MKDKIHHVKCRSCNQVNDIVDGYLYYFRQFIKHDKRATLICPKCHAAIRLPKSDREKLSVYSVA
jgi:Zn finger protein HypA/HybF involved in hydrogenase expression